MKGFLEKIDEFLRRMKKGSILVIVFLIVVLLALVDYVAGFEISMSVFYLIPIFLGTWYLGIGTGRIMVLVSVLARSLVNLLAGQPYSQDSVRYWDMLLQLATFGIFAFLLHELRSAIRHERAMARTDELTGISNRREFFTQAELEIRRAKRHGYVFSLAYFDLDFFKQVNDERGHTEGDKVLKAISGLISGVIRQTDLFARLGGDEFALLLPDTAQKEARVVLEKVEKIVSDEMTCLHMPVTLSIGAVTFNSPPASVDEMIAKADSLMYQAKLGGKNQTLYFQVD